MADRASERLVTLIRAEALRGRAPEDGAATTLLAEVGASAAETSHLAALLREGNGGAFEADAIRRQAAVAVKRFERRLTALEDMTAARLLPAQTLGGAAMVAGLIGFAGGTAATFGAVPVMLGGAVLFGLASAARESANAEKARIREARDGLALMIPELEKLAPKPK